MPVGMFVIGLVLGAAISAAVVFRLVLNRMAQIIARMDAEQIDELAQRVTDARYGPEERAA